MKRGTFLYAIATVAVVASLYLGLGLFLPGCAFQHCDAQVDKSGAYSVQYIDQSGNTLTKAVGSNQYGWVRIDTCDRITQLSYLGPVAADLRLQMTAPSMATVGQPLTYTFTVDNLGPNDVTNVHLSDTLPSGVNYRSASVPCVLSAPIVDCDRGTTMDLVTDKFEIVVIPTAAGPITNTARVASDILDPDLNSSTTDNKASLTTTVNAPGTGCTGNADLSVLASHFFTLPGAMFNPIQVFIQVFNYGPDPAQNVIVTDTLSGPATFSTFPSTCTQSGNVVSCPLGSIPACIPDSSVGGCHPDTFITATPIGDHGMITEIVSVTSTTCDPTPDGLNETKTISVTVPQ